MFWLRASAALSGRRVFLAVCSGLALVAAATLPLVAADDDESEVPIGTFYLKPDLGPDRRPVEPPDARGEPGAGYGTEAASEAVEELFKTALAALEAGRKASAQRLFERLIARAPDSARAAEARRYLAALYLVPGEKPAPAEGRGKTLRPGAEGRPAGEAPKSLLLARRSSGTPAPAAVEEQFVAEAGDRVFFSEGSAELGGRAHAVLAAQARFIMRRLDLDATIEGHADDAPLTLEQQDRLSEARAEAVRRRLIEEGVEQARLEIAPWGRDRRLSRCPAPECEAQNRRAVTVLILAGSRRTSGPMGDRPSAIPLTGGDAADATQ